MKFCSKCNAHYEDDVFFCLQDGSPLEDTDKVRVNSDNPNYTGEGKQIFDSEQTVTKNDEPAIDNKSIVTEVLPNPNDSEVTVVRPNSHDSEVTVIRPSENKSEATLVRPNPLGIDIPKTEQFPPINIPKTEQFPPIDNRPTPNIEFATTDSDSKHTLKIAAIASTALILIIALCVISGAFESPADPIVPEGVVDTNVDYPLISDDNDSTADTDEFPNLTLEDQESAINLENPQANGETESNVDNSIFDEIVKTPVPTPEPLKKGRIRGKLTYPSHGIPPDLHICVQEINKNITACSNRKKANFEFKVNRSAVNYSVTLPDGTYYIYATDPILGKAYYTQYVVCGMAVGCTSHKKIPIKIKDGKTVGGIMVGDWYNF